jgi:hypothetical protein
MEDRTMAKRKSQSEFWMLVRRGKTVRIGATKHGKPTKIWPVAETEADARKLAKHVGEGTRAALIGSAPGETLQNHIALAMEDGCAAIACVAGWKADGSPKWKWLPIDED